MTYEILSVVLAAAWLVTLLLYANANAQTRDAWRHVDTLMEELNQLYRNSIRRDPKTGRYMKKGR